MDTIPSSVAVLATAWGPRYGGINSLNRPLCEALAKECRSTIICVVPRASSTDRKEADRSGVRLLSLDVDGDDFGESLGAIAAERVAAEGLLPVSHWVGHDAITGAAALEARKATPSASTVVIHHMDYRAYETFKDYDALRAEQKVGEQRRILSEADFVCAVGPKLTKSARDHLTRSAAADPAKTVVELVPGFPEIEGCAMPEHFQAITFGRIEQRLDRVKQVRLAAEAFGKAIEQYPNEIGDDPSIMLLGLPSKNLKALNKNLHKLVASRAKRQVSVRGLPYKETQSELFDAVRGHSAALMLSFTEGFGLVAWEAIAAEVPVIISKNSGVYELIFVALGGPGLGCIHAVDVSGTEEQRESDIAKVAVALADVARDKVKAKSDARALKKMLGALYSWRWCARALASACNIPLIHEPVRLGLAAGHPDKRLCGPCDPGQGVRTDQQSSIYGAWRSAAEAFGEELARRTEPSFHILFSGVHGGTFAGFLVKRYLEVGRDPSAITTYAHDEFRTDEQAREILSTKYPQHFVEHNVDPTVPYLLHVGQIFRAPLIERRRNQLVADSHALLCVAGSFAVLTMVDIAKLRGIPVVAVAAFGGYTWQEAKALMSYNRSLGLSEGLTNALDRLQDCSADPNALCLSFRQVLAGLAEHARAQTMTPSDRRRVAH
jgi:glycosyltransferase involved in cell wall biosynthesis